MQVIPHFTHKAVASVLARQVQQVMSISSDFNDPDADIGADFIGDFANLRLSLKNELAVLQGQALGKATELRIVLFTADEGVGFCSYTKQEPTGTQFTWLTSEPEAQTDRASLTLFKQGKEVDAIELAGDDWREFEDRGGPQAVAQLVLKGKPLGDAIDAILPPISSR